MKVENLEIEGLKLIIPDVHGDARGWFVEIGLPILLSEKDQKLPPLAQIEPRVVLYGDY